MIDTQQTVESVTERANYWRHVAFELAGGDKARVSAAEDTVCDKFIAAGRTRIGPKLPPTAGTTHE